VIQNFVHLRYIYIPYNRLRNLEALARMIYLCLLDVGHNYITNGTDIPNIEFLEVTKFVSKKEKV
jgi:hypothetical protein